MSGGEKPILPRPISGISEKSRLNLIESLLRLAATFTRNLSASRSKLLWPREAPRQDPPPSPYISNPHGAHGANHHQGVLVPDPSP